MRKILFYYQKSPPPQANAQFISILRKNLNIGKELSEIFS